MKNNELLIGVDLGTSAVKAILADSSGNILAQAGRSVQLIHPEEHIYEMDPLVYYRNICSLFKELTAKVDNPKKIRAVSFCTASGNTLLLDENYNPVTNVINWMDTRTFGKEQELWPEIDKKEIYEKCGWPWSGFFPLAHLAWLKDFQPKIWKKARYCTMLDGYLYYLLCRNLVVDPSKGTTFFLQDQVKGTWNRKLLSFLGISEENLPKILPSGTSAGNITPEATLETGLSRETLVVTGSFDHPSAARSAGVFHQGDLLISAGTSWVAFAPVKNREAGINGGMLIDPFLSPEGCWGVMFSLTAVAEKMKYFLTEYINSGEEEAVYNDFNRLSGAAEPGAGGCFINPWQETVDETRERLKNTSRENIARALMEGCAFLLKNQISKLEKFINTEMKRVVLVGGPTKSPVWPGIIAAILNRPCAIPETGQHTGALGAVIFAGLGAGIYPSVEEARKQVAAAEKNIEPDKNITGKYEKIYRSYTRRYHI